MFEYIRVVSDVHLDFDLPQNPKNFLFEMLWKPEPLKEDKKTLLIIAGDIWHSKKYYDYQNKNWLKEISKNFYAVIVVLGNHDFWGGNIHKEYDDFNKAIKTYDMKNVFLLQNRTIKFGDLKLVGGTLWTDYNNADYKCMTVAKLGFMKDYSYITSGFLHSKIAPKTILQEHLKTKKYIDEFAKKDYPEQKIWVITHHLPSHSSLPFEFSQEGMENENALYASHMDSFIEQRPDINVWVHGHSHRYQNYKIGKTRIIANPRGYTNENTGFDPWLRFDINGNQMP